jgi:hypothetical protein
MNHIQQLKNENDTFLFTSESVGEGHPGKKIFQIKFSNHIKLAIFP